MSAARCCVAIAVLSLSVAAIAAGQTIRYSTFDRMYVKLKQPVEPVSPRATIVLMMYHSYPTSLHNVRIEGQAPGVSVACAEPAVSEMLPTTMIDVPVRIARVKESLTSDSIDLTLTLRADEVAKPATLHFNVPMTEEGAARLAQETAMPVGEIEIRVDPRRDYTFAAYSGVVAVLIAALVWRRWRMEQDRG
jgi:hypothetical protein